MTAVSTFSAFRLPHAALLQVLKKMDFLELISLSLVSKRSKKLVKLLSFPCHELDIIPGMNFFKLLVFLHGGHIQFQLDHAEDDRNQLTQLPSRVHIGIRIDNYQGKSGFRWTNQGLTNEKWIKHIHSVFRFSTPVKATFLADQALDFRLLRDGLPKIFRLEIIVDIEKEITRLILKTFGPEAEKLSLRGDPCNELYTVQQLLIQNWDDLHWIGAEKLRIDDLSMMNARYIRMNPSFNFPLRDLNHFLKNWIRGSNPRLSYFFIKQSTNVSFDINAIMNGINYQVVADDVERVHEYRLENVRGGMDIRNKNGKLATVVLSYGTRFELFVWN